MTKQTCKFLTFRDSFYHYIFQLLLDVESVLSSLIDHERRPIRIEFLTLQVLAVVFSDFYRQHSFGFQALRTIMHRILLTLTSSTSFGALLISGT